MFETLQLCFLMIAILVSFAGTRWLEGNFNRINWVRHVADKRRLVAAALGCAAFLGGLALAGILHEPVPKIDDEFSYLLMSNTFATGHVANPTPSSPEFFETFHVIVRPAYVSKYFPAQGVFLALGERLTRHPAVGIWLGSALACVATCWMLQAWVGPVWGMLGALLLLLQWGVDSYWSQTYWGGMVAALGGALFFGALRRLWDRHSWPSAIWLGTGIVVLGNSRPLEGLIAVAIAGAVLANRVWRQRQWATWEFWRELVIPAGAILLLGVAATSAYNRATTGSAFTPPYVVHERQYQGSPPFLFLPERPPVPYSSPVLQRYYEDYELAIYRGQRHFFPWAMAQRLGRWWGFYCGILFSLPFVLPVLLRRGWIAFLQIALLAAWILLPADPNIENMMAVGSVADGLAVAQVVLLWLVFDSFWPRLAISIATATMVFGLVCKWWFPHYFAPVACLVLLLQIEGLRRMWHWRSGSVARGKPLHHRKGHRPAGAAPIGTFGLALRNLVCLFPIVCLLSLGMRVAAHGNRALSEQLPSDWQTLLTEKNDWSQERAVLKQWLEGQPGPQLVFVQYAPEHNVFSEWVYNNADLLHSKVVWARDLGPEHNRLLLQQMPDRTVWSLAADRPMPRLLPYSEAIASALDQN